MLALRCGWAHAASEADKPGRGIFRPSIHPAVPYLTRVLEAFVHEMHAFFRDGHEIHVICIVVWRNWLNKSSSRQLKPPEAGTTQVLNNLAGIVSPGTSPDIVDFHEEYWPRATVRSSLGTLQNIKLRPLHI